MTKTTTQGVLTILHPVSDIEAATSMYVALTGIQPQADSDYYVGFDIAGQHIGLVPGGAEYGMTGPVPHWHVDDIEAKLAEVTAAGATVQDPPREVAPGRLVATFTDPDGNRIGLIEDK